MSSRIQRDVGPSGRTVQLLPQAAAEVRTHAQAGYPHEVVGILAGHRDSGRVSRVQRLVNTRADRAADRYEVDPLALMKAERALEAEGFEIVGYYHSHPDHPAMYSDTDRDLALPEMAYLIASISGARNGDPAPRVMELRCWRLCGDRGEMLEDSLLFPLS